MNKRIIIWAIVALVCVSFAIFLALSHDSFDGAPALTEKDLVKAAKKLDLNEVPPQTAVAPLNLTHPIRLAIGSLGFADDERNHRLSDLVLAELSGAKGLNLVERQSLEAALREMSLGLSGLVRAKDAVRVGKLLKADWFLLGTEAKINGTDSIVVRVVDARTGILRDAGVFPRDESLTQLAADLAAFVRQTRLNAASAKPRVYLAIGAFEDLSVNNRQANFPTQLRGYLTAAYQGGKVTLLEREYVDTLLQEVRLDLAGLTQEGGTNPPQPMQSAFWLVSGQSQSYDTTNLQVELNLDVQRIFGTIKHFTLRGLPVRPVGEQVKRTIDQVMNQSLEVIVPSRMSEARAQLAIGKELEHLNPVFGDIVLIYVNSEYWDPDQSGFLKSKRNLEEAIRAFQAVLLLDPGNHEAKMHLAACLRNPVIYKLDKARSYYREIIEDAQQDWWSGQGQRALLASFENWAGRTDLNEMVRWFASAARQMTNSPAAAFYQKQLETAEANATILQGGSSKAEGLAEKKLFESIQTFNRVLHGGTGKFASGMDEFVTVFGTNRTAAARRLVQLLPQMISQAPELEPHLLAEVVTFQVDANEPVVSEFQVRLAQISEPPNQVFAADRFWNIVDPGIYDWSIRHKFYALAAQAIEGKLKRAAEGNFFLKARNSEDRIALAYAYLGMERWQQALAVFESFSNRPVEMLSNGPWGRGLKPVLTDKLAAYCREKMGLATLHNSEEFDLGPSCMNLTSVFTTDADGLWVAGAGQLMRLDFGLKTNLIANLPIDFNVPITCLCVGSEKIWIGTSGAGLVEFDKASRECRRLTEANGLMMDYLTALHATGDSLWIGYGSDAGGGLGQLDLSSGKFKSFMPGLNQDAAQAPPRRAIAGIAAGSNGDLWLLANSEVQQLHVAQNTWETVHGRFVSCISANFDRLAVGTWSGTRWEIHTLHDKKWQSFAETNAVPGTPTVLALDGNDLWVGGTGYISLLDLKENKVKRFCHIGTESVDRIQFGGGYIWAQFDGHLHRASLADLR